jgi:hypothetical protein
MKRQMMLIMWFCGLILAQTIVFGQSNFRLGLQFSPGLSYFQIPDGDLNRRGAKFFYQYGLIADYAFTENYFLNTGLQVSNMGGKIGFENLAFRIDKGADFATSTITERNFSLQYIEVPLNFKLRTSEIGYSKYFGLFGISPGIRLNSSSIDSEIALNGTNAFETKRDISDEVGLFRVGLNIGAGIERLISGKTHYIIQINWSNGLNNILLRENENIYNSPIRANGKRVTQNLNNDALYVTVGVMF